MVNMGTAVGYLTLDITGFARSLDSASADLNKLTGNATSASGQALQTIGSGITTAGAALTAGLTAPIVGFGAESVRAGSDFDKTMSQVQAVSSTSKVDIDAVKAAADAMGITFQSSGGDSERAMDALRQAAIHMGEQTKFTAQESGDALYYMGLAGWGADQMIQGLPGILNLAAAGNLEVGRTSDIVTDALTAFGQSADQSTHFADSLAAAMSNSNTDVDQLGEAFKYCGAYAGSFGYSIDDVSVALGLMANNGIKGSTAGTTLRQMLVQLSKPTDKAAALMDKYGVSLFNADGTTKGLDQVMGELRGTFGNLGIELQNADGSLKTTEQIMEEYGHSLPMSEQEKLTDLVNIFGTRAMPGVLSIIQASDETFNNLTEAVGNSSEAFVLHNGELMTYADACAKYGEEIVRTGEDFEILGAAQGMAMMQLDNLAGDWTYFTSALGTTKIIISDMVKGALREFVQKLTELVRAFNNMSPEQQQFIVKMAAIVAAIGPVLMVVGKMVSTFGKLKTAASILGPIFSSVGANIGTTIGAFRNLSVVCGGPLKAALAMVQGGLSTLLSPVTLVVAAIAVLVAAFVHLMKTNDEFRENIMSKFSAIGDKLQETFQRITDAVNSLGFDFENIKEVISAAWEGLCSILAPVFEGAFTVIVDTFSGAMDIIAGAIEFICGLLNGDMMQAWEGLKSVVTGVFEILLAPLDGIGEALWGWISALTGCNMSWDEVKQTVADFVTSIPDKFKQFVDNVVQWFSELPGKIGEFINNIWTAITTWVGNMVSKAVELGTNFVNGVVQWFQQLPERIGTFVSNVWTAITTFVSNMVSKALELGQNFLNNVVQFFSQLPYNIGYVIGLIIGTVGGFVANMIAKAIELGSNFLNNIVSFFSQLPGQILNFITLVGLSIGQWVVNMVNKAKEMGQNFLNNVVSFFTQLPGKVLQFITSVLTNVQQWATNMVNKAKEMAQNFLQNVVSFFQQLPGKVKSFIDSVFNNVKQWATNMINKAKEMAQNFLNNIVTFFQQLPGKIKSFLDSAFNNVKSWVTNMVNKAKEMATNFINNIVSTLQALPGKIKSILDSALNNVKQWVTDMGKKGLEAAKELINKFLEGAKNVGETVKSVGQNIVDGVWNGIQAAKDAFVSKVKDFFSGIVDGVKDALGIESPSKVFRDQVGYWIPMGVAEGVDDAMPEAIDDIQNSLDKGLDKLDTNDIIDIDVIGTFSSVIFEAADIFGTVCDRLISTISEVSDTMSQMILEASGVIDDGSQMFGGSTFGIQSGSFRDRISNGTLTVNDGKSTTNGNGDTYYVFNSPKAIDEIEATRLMKRTERDIAEGFA